jgi:hypothetical protein
VVLFWQVLNSQFLHGRPEYTGDLTALKTLNWKNMWGNVLLATPKYWYYRIPPTALLPLSLLDREFLAPAFGIHFPSGEFRYAARLAAEGTLGAACMSLAVYLLSVTLGSRFSKPSWSAYSRGYSWAFVFSLRSPAWYMSFLSW